LRRCSEAPIANYFRKQYLRQDDRAAGGKAIMAERSAAPVLNLSGCDAEESAMIRKLPSGKYRLYSRKVNPKTGRRRNLGTFASRAAAAKHERAVQYFKRH
jgi:hypothetical protein